MRYSLIIASLAAFCAHMAFAEDKYLDTTFSPSAITPIVNSTYKHFDCGVSKDTHASLDFKKTIKALHKASSSDAHTGSHHALVHARATTPINVPTYFHIITTRALAGTITQATADAQLKAMNKAYSPYGITFSLLGTTFTANDAWAVAAGPDMAAVKAALRQGTYGTLNIYFHTDLDGGVLGTCTLPSNIGPVAPSPSTYVSDGCNVQAHTMPGGSALGYDTGMTAVHETGHWLGLLHTFEGYACTGDGDSVGDTPMQSTSTDGCPKSPAKDSCPGLPGKDAIHNYMDYSTDACYQGFTGLQVQRMRDLWVQYRQGR